MAEKSGVNVIRSIFELLVLLLALGVIFGGLALIYSITLVPDGTKQVAGV